jgi:DNA-binding transcriptional ArsR family regulator
MSTMSYLLLKERQGSQLVPARVFSDPKVAQTILQPMRWKILNELIKDEKCAKDLSKILQTSEQVICYHLKELERAGFVRIEKTNRIRGAMAKYYRADQKAIAVIPSPGSLSRTSALSLQQPLMETSSKLLEPFIAQGRFNGHIVLGNPEIHGLFRAGARDGDRATDLALFLGSLLPLTRESVVRLDTEMSQQELQQNLIIVGPPKVNTVAMMVNDWLPITYDLSGHGMMISRISNKNYSGDYEGAIQMIVNPMNQDSRVLVIAGNTFLGTRAAILAFIKHIDEITAGNIMNRNIVARVVSGLDTNNDGLLEETQFLE